MNNDVEVDSLIFDMDGTLWDATDSYVVSWNRAFKKYGMDRTIERATLDRMMGWEWKKVFAELFPDLSERDRLKLAEVVAEALEAEMGALGGKLYDGVKENLQKLSERYKLFIVSNCPAKMIKMMMKWAGIAYLIADEFAYGANMMPKSHNINILRERHDLKNPVYVGDTEGDGIQSRLAGIPFIFVSYGFGETTNYDLKFDSFSQLTNYFLSIE